MGKCSHMVPFPFVFGLLLTNLCFPSETFACVSMFLDGGGRGEKVGGGLFGAKLFLKVV